MAEYVIPVSGVSAGSLSDSYGADRDGGSRSHKGIDIFADRGTPVVAAVSGVVRKAGDSGGKGGLRVWVEGDDGRAYYYAHLDSISVKSGQRVEAGTPLGGVGTTGNASSTPPHLHFSINSKVGPEDGVVNPYTFLTTGKATTVTASSEEIAPAETEGEPDGPGINATDDEIRAWLIDEYGYVSWMFDHPEIGSVFKQAVREGRDQEWLKGALYGTDWWKSNEDAVRQWETLKNENPGEADARLQTELQEIRMAATRMGINVHEQRLRQMAEDSLKYGWTPNELNIALTNEANYNPQQTSPQGTIGQAMNSVKAEAANWMVPIGDKGAYNWALALQQQTATMDSFRSYLSETAKARFPHLEKWIDKGIAPSQFFEPYKQELARILEIDPNTVDLSDSRWSPITEFVTDSGERRPMTMYEIGDWARSQEEWERTDEAHRQTSQMTEYLAKTWGKIA